MLGVDARSVAVGWFVVVISIGTLEAGQRSPARPRQRLIGGWGCYPSSQQRSWSSMPRRRSRGGTLDAVRRGRPGRHESRAELSGATEEASLNLTHRGAAACLVHAPIGVSTRCSSNGRIPELSRACLSALPSSARPSSAAISPTGALHRGHGRRRGRASGDERSRHRLHRHQSAPAIPS